MRRTLPLTLRERLAESLPFWALAPDDRVESGDGTVKWALRAVDGAVVEAVLIAHAEGRRTVCVSSQVGCALGCKFCATGAMGPGRNMTASEIVDQVVLAGRESESQGARLTNVVFMGMGEPMQNLDAVLKACGTINHPEGIGISARRIAISTVGWVPGIATLAEHPLPVRLAISLHAADDATRTSLMPINARYPIASLLAACRRYCDTTGRRVFIEYLLLKGVNDSPADARRLARLLRDGRFHVNLIEYNAAGGDYTGSSYGRRARCSCARSPSWGSRRRCDAPAERTSPRRAASSPEPLSPDRTAPAGSRRAGRESREVLLLVGQLPRVVGSRHPAHDPDRSITKVALPATPNASR